jgi:hypothetical protein
LALLLACASACSFPHYTAHEDAAGGGAGASGSAEPPGGTAGSSLGGAGASGMGGTAATAGVGATAGAGASAGAGGNPEPGIVMGWSESSLEQLDFDLLGSAQLFAGGVAITNKDVKNMLGGLVQKRQLDLGAEPSLEVVLGFRIMPGSMNGDGLAIVLHASPDGPTRLGSGGGGLAYGGISPCVAIELDTAEIAAADLPAPHLGLMPACNPDEHGPATTALGGDPSDGADWTLAVGWSGDTQLLDVTLRREATGRETHLSEPLDLTTLVGQKLYVAVTAANGEFSATHFVRSLRLGGGGLELRTLK